MSIPQPTLDDRTYADLLEEAKALIPSVAPEWTNHNPSDPGITLVELFAWLTEMLLFQIDRLPKANTHAFLRLLNGPGWKPGPDLDEDIRATVLDLRQRYRAVTAEDYEVLALEASPLVARAHCVPRRNLAGGSATAWLSPREGCVSLIVVPDPAQAGALDPASWTGAPLASPGLLSTVRQHLEPRRLLAVRQAVASPIYVPIQAEIVLVAQPDLPAGPLQAGVENALNGYLDALTGGPEGDGWPFGRDVYVSELYRLLEKEVPGVDSVLDISLSSACPEKAPRCIAGVELWHEEGDLIGIGLSAHGLPWARIDAARIVVGSKLLPVGVEIKAVPEEGFQPAAVRRAVKSAVKRHFVSISSRPEGGGLREITRGEILSRVASLPEIKTAQIVLKAAPARLSQETLRFEPGEIADLTVTVGF